MDERFAILALLSAENKKELVGRTLLQKKIYFLNEILGLDLDFRPHYYGPYSAALANALDSLVALGFVAEECETFPRVADPYGDQKRYQYTLAPDGEVAIQVFAESEDAEKAKRIGDLVRQMDKCAQAHNYQNLSVAAKIYHIVKGRQRATVSELKKEALSLGWQLPDQLITSSIEFLKAMGLVETESPELSST